MVELEIVRQLHALRRQGWGTRGRGVGVGPVADDGLPVSRGADAGAPPAGAAAGASWDAAARADALRYSRAPRTRMRLWSCSCCASKASRRGCAWCSKWSPAGATYELSFLIRLLREEA